MKRLNIGGRAAPLLTHTSRMPIRTQIPLSILFACLALAGCATTRSDPPPPPSSTAQTTSPNAVREIAERYVGAATPAEELDSLATWTNPEGRRWLIASGKATDRLSVYDADTGALLRTIGGPGDAPGRFNRPNGLAVAGDALFVVERDNHRVQVLSLPGFAPVGSFGADALRSPYGLWLNPIAPGAFDAYVTDSFMEGPKHDVVPSLDQLDRRVHRFRVRLDGARLQAEDRGSFGDTSADGALRMVESIAGDPQHDRLLVADESTAREGAIHGSTLREYTLAGRYTGRSLPDRSFAAEAEGVVLWQCAGDAGYWIAVDQLSPLTVFHVFDRGDLRLRGSFRGRTTAFTDGIALHAGATPRFPSGALFAVHDDKAVAAFDLRDVVRTLGLAPGCVRQG